MPLRRDAGFQPAPRGARLLAMNPAPQTQVQDEPPASRAGIWLLVGGAGLLLLAGLLLWWREGDRLFTDGLIAAILACF